MRDRPLGNLPHAALCPIALPADERMNGIHVEPTWIIADRIARGQRNRETHQNGFTMTMITMMNISTVGTSFATR